MSPISKEVADRIKSRYTAYWNTTDPDAKGLYYAADCMQICGPVPTYAAKDATTIVEYVKEGSKKGASMNNKADGAVSGYTFRPLRDDEFVFESDKVVAHIDSTSAELKQKAEREAWVGTRVDMWFPVAEGGAMLLKVHYWWRKDGNEWKQVLHDIMYMGPLDGTEGTEGERLA